MYIKFSKHTIFMNPYKKILGSGQQLGQIQNYWYDTVHINLQTYKINILNSYKVKKKNVKCKIHTSLSYTITHIYTI